MEGVRSHEHYNQEAVGHFQDLTNDWFKHYVVVTGKDGFYLKEWGNLYQYSQQGREAYNSLLKSVYYHRTQRGGFGGKRNDATSQVAPLGHWMQRKLFFQSGNYLACENI
jgi:hypothetical protein